MVKIPTFNAGDPCSVPGWRRSAYHAVWLKKKVPSSGEELMMKEVLSSTHLSFTMIFESYVSTVSECKEIIKAVTHDDSFDIFF